MRVAVRCSTGIVSVIGLLLRYRAEIYMAQPMSKTVLIVGQICADLITVCEQYPEEDVQVRVRAQYWQRGGNAGNIAEVLSYLGTRAEFYGTYPDINKMEPTILGGAAAARFCLSELDRAGVEYGHLALRECPDFPSSSILLSENTGTRTITHYRGPLDELTIADFSALDFKEYCWVHFEGRSNVEVIKKAVQLINDKNTSLTAPKKTKISVELELPRHDELIDVCGLTDLVVVSRYFARHRGYNTAKECVEELRPLLKTGAVIVCSWGEVGAACCTSAPNDEACLVPAVKPEKVIDTLGAGDTFQAALIHARLFHLSLIESVQFACRVSSRKISSKGYESVKGMGLTYEVPK